MPRAKRPVDPNSPQDPPLWSITKQVPTSLPDQHLGAVPAIEVFFTIPGGHQASVTVPTSDYTPERVEAVVHDMASRLFVVQNMEGPPVSQLGMMPPDQLS